MKALARALENQGTPVPFRFNPRLEIYPGNLVILIAAPNVGKSFLGLNWAVDLVNQGMPVLYHTTDTDYATQAKRFVALMKGIRIDDANGSAAAWLDEVVLPLRWSQATVNIDTVDDLVQAEIEYLGETPALVIIDVANDIRKGEENVGNIRDVFSMLHKVARRHRCVVLAMHHVKRGAASSGKVKPSMDDGLYGGEQIAEVVLTLWRPNQDQLGLSVEKNRAGQAGYHEYLPFSPERGRIT